MPVYAAKAGGFFFIVFGVLALISALVQINPIWAYGPYDPSPVTAGSQPDWYMGFADGALRLLPGWLEFEFWGFTLSLNVAIGALFLIPIMYGRWRPTPSSKAWVTGDKREHHLLDRPRNHPDPHRARRGRMTFYGVLMFAAGNDIMAIKLHMSINDITYFFRDAGSSSFRCWSFWATVASACRCSVTTAIWSCTAVRAARIVRTAEGKFFEAHEPLDEYTRWKLVGYERQAPLELTGGVDAHGVADRSSRGAKLRARLSQFYFGTHVDPVTPTELAAAHHDGHAHEAIEAAPSADESEPAQVGRH
jgi:ubiquinol-cytochrome c reductase cytochrome b subunit